MFGAQKPYREGEQVLYYEAGRGYYLLTVESSGTKQGFLGIGKKIVYSGETAEVVFSKRREQWEILSNTGRVWGIEHDRLLNSILPSQIKDKRFDHNSVVDISHLVEPLTEH